MNKMLNHFIQGLQKSVQREVLKENPSTFGDACMLAECIGRLDDFVWESGGNNKGYAPMDLDAVNAPMKIARLTYSLPLGQIFQHAIIVAKKVISHAIAILKAQNS